MHRKFIALIGLSVLLAIMGACASPSRYDALPRASKPVPKEFLTYFLAYGNSRVRPDMPVPEVFASYHRRMNEATSTALRALDLSLSAYQNTLKAVLTDDYIAMAAAKTQLDEADQLSQTAQKDFDSAQRELTEAHSRYLADYGLQPPVTYRRVLLLGKSNWIVSSSGLLQQPPGGKWQDAVQFKGFSVYDLAIDGGRGWGVGPGGDLLQLADDETWRSFSAKLQSLPDLNAVALDQGATAWAAGDKGIILRFDGSEWKDVRSSGEQQGDLLGIAVSPDGGGWAVGASGTILKRNGEQWQDSPGVPSDLKADLSAVVSGQTDAWAVGSGGTVLHYSDSQWTQVTAPVTTTLTSVALTTDGDTWVVGEDGVILRCVPSACQKQASPTAYRLEDVAVSADGKTGWIVGRNNTILRLDGKKWFKVVDWQQMAKGK